MVEENFDLPYVYKQYLEDGVRSSDIKHYHWKEVMEIVKMTTKYNQSQLAEKLSVSVGTISRHLTGEHMPRHSEEALEELKKVVKRPKVISLQAHGRAYA